MIYNEKIMIDSIIESLDSIPPDTYIGRYMTGNIAPPDGRESPSNLQHVYLVWCARKLTANDAIAAHVATSALISYKLIKRHHYSHAITADATAFVLDAIARHRESGREMTFSAFVADNPSMLKWMGQDGMAAAIYRVKR